MIMQADDNLLIATLSCNISALDLRSNEHFPTWRAESEQEKDESRELLPLCFMMPTRIIYMSSENRKQETMSTARMMFSRASAFLLLTLFPFFLVLGNV